LAGDNTNVLLRYINALIMANNGTLTDRAGELTRRVLEIEPENYTALLYSAFAAEQHGDLLLANDYYRKILPALQGSPEMQMTINQLLARNEQLLADQGPDTGTPAPETDSPPPVSLSLRVSVADNLGDLFAPGDTLFIYAQAMDGPPMPLAVVRRQAGDLPLDVVLDDSMAMMPAHRLSAFAQVKVQARISRSGNAQPESGDLVGEMSGIDVTGSGKITLVINEVVP
jgi:cytochrome c-type biogenesis protein CcmH